jgi:hypothetical protein
VKGTYYVVAAKEDADKHTRPHAHAPMTFSQQGLHYHGKAEGADTKIITTWDERADGCVGRGTVLL